MNDIIDAKKHEVLKVTICPGCNCEIDEETCHCGDHIKTHGYDSGHGPVPKGCICGYYTKEDMNHISTELRKL